MARLSSLNGRFQKAIVENVACPFAKPGDVLVLDTTACLAHRGRWLDRLFRCGPPRGETRDHYFLSA